MGYGWASHEFPMPATAEPGLYAIQSRVPAAAWSSGATAYFVVRPSVPTADIVLCWPFATMCAYAGGAAGTHVNVYDSYQPGRLRTVSLRRPFDRFPFNEDKRVRTIVYPFLVWQHLVSAGFAVEPITSFDLDRDPNVLDPYQLFVPAGHDEYGSLPGRNVLEAHIAGEKNAAFLTANACWWPVRLDFAAGTMACYKSAVEDPMSGVDDGAVTANWASAPVLRPENALTGVSYRRGSSFAPAPAFIVAAADSYFDGTGLNVGDSFGAGLLGYETDAVALDANKQPTFLDGTPSTFVVLATADGRAGLAGQPGWATLGRYTNGGTVFTAATTEWASGLDPAAPDSDIQRITTNVITRLEQPAVGPPASFVAPDDPGSTWGPVPNDATGAMVAIAGCPTGHLFVMRPSSGPVDRRDPEVLRSPQQFTATAIPHVADVRAMTTDVLGRYVFVGQGPAILAPAGIKRRVGRPDDSASWADYIAPPLTNQACVGLGALADLFVALDGVGDRWLYRLPVTPSGGDPLAWKKLGRWPGAYVALSAFDGKLFAATSTGELWCREANVIDLVWTKIGAVPTQVFSLAAYYGRLFALTGTPASATLQWRAATASAVTPFRVPSMLFVDSGGDAMVGTLSGNGELHVTGTTQPAIPFTIVTRANDGFVFFYASNGAAKIGRFDEAGVFAEVNAWDPGAFGTWTHIVYVNDGASEHVFFYKTGGGLGIVGRFNGDGDFIQEWWSGTFFSGWTHITAAHSGYLAFYQQSTGRYAFGVLSTGGAYTNLLSGTGITRSCPRVRPSFSSTVRQPAPARSASSRTARSPRCSLGVISRRHRSPPRRRADSSSCSIRPRAARTRGDSSLMAGKSYVRSRAEPSKAGTA